MPAHHRHPIRAGPPRRSATAPRRFDRWIAALAGAFLTGVGCGCDPTPPPALVAPVFRHGPGYGERRHLTVRSGTEPQRHVAEEDALLVIQDEFRRHGLQPDATPHRLDEVIIHGYEVVPATEWVTQRRALHWRPIAAPLVVDLWIPEHRVGVEYVSEPEFDQFGGDERRQWNRNLILVAERLGSAVRAQGRGFVFGAIYDPATSVLELALEPEFQAELARSAPGAAEDPLRELDWWADEFETRAAARNEERLRAQVRDLVNWLKTQGAI